MELGVQCQRNAQTWHQQAQAALATHKLPPHRTRTFTQRLNNAKVSTNVDAGKILEFDRAKSLLHSRQLAVLEGQRTSPSQGSLTSLRNWHQRPWSSARSAFESLWHHGRRIIYGAINIGGPGADTYGPFCLVIDDPTSPGTRRAPGRPAHVALFPKDTAQTYAGPGGAANKQAAARDAACWASRSDVAIVKHAADLNTTTTAGWDQLVCSERSYIEVCIADPIAVTDINSVRISRKLRRLRTSAYAQHDSLSPVDERLAEAVATIERWGAFGVAVEVV